MGMPGLPPGTHVCDWRAGKSEQTSSTGGQPVKISQSEVNMPKNADLRSSSGQVLSHGSADPPDVGIRPSDELQTVVACIGRVPIDLPQLLYPFFSYLRLGSNTHRSDRGAAV